MDTDDVLGAGAPIYAMDRLSSTEGVVKPESMAFDERRRVEQAASRARLVFPGAIGAYLGADLDSWSRLSLRLDGKSLTAQLVEAILGMPIPEEKKNEADA